MIIEITKAETKNTKTGKPYLPFTYKVNGEDAYAAAWKEADIKAYSGPGKYELTLEEQKGKDGKVYVNASGLKLISLSPTTPAGIPVSSLDPNRLITERATTARAAMIIAKDLAIASGKPYYENVRELAEELFRKMQSLSTGKIEKSGINGD